MAQAGFFSQGDHKRVSGLLKSNVRDLQSAYYAAIGLKALGADIPAVRSTIVSSASVTRLQSVCGYAQKANAGDLTEVFYAASIADAVSSCQVCALVGDAATWHNAPSDQAERSRQDCVRCACQW